MCKCDEYWRSGAAGCKLKNDCGHGWVQRTYQLCNKAKGNKPCKKSIPKRVDFRNLTTTSKNVGPCLVCEKIDASKATYDEIMQQESMRYDQAVCEANKRREQDAKGAKYEDEVRLAKEHYDQAIQLAKERYEKDNEKPDIFNFMLDMSSFPAREISIAVEDPVA